MGEIEYMKLIKKGAEASLYLTKWHDRKVIMKVRLPKKYRPPELDERIRTYRTAHEPQLMHEAKMAGVPTPIIFLVDMNKATITMEYVEGQQVKKLIDTLSMDEGKKLCEKIGGLIGNLHQHGVIHGDLTTSNMILTREGKIFLVDFGLGEKNTELEAKGVDLHLMKRALQSTHYEIAEECFRSVLFGYSSVVGNEKTREVMEKIREIEQRGRYVAERQEKA